MSVIGVAMGEDQTSREQPKSTRKGKEARLAYISEFVEEAKASGLIQRIIDKSGLRGFQVSPPVSASTR